MLCHFSPDLEVAAACRVLHFFFISGLKVGFEIAEI